MEGAKSECLDGTLFMAQVMLGAKGMWVELQLVPNTGGQRSIFPLAWQVVASFVWAVVSQIYEPHCANVRQLSEVDMNYWFKQGFYCAPQAEVGDHTKGLSR
jgi:hypothetical protein